PRTEALGAEPRRRLRRQLRRHRGRGTVRGRAALPWSRLLADRAVRPLDRDPDDRHLVRPLPRPRRGAARAGPVRLHARLASLTDGERLPRDARARDLQHDRPAEHLLLVLALLVLALLTLGLRLGFGEVLG